MYLYTFYLQQERLCEGVPFPLRLLWPDPFEPWQCYPWCEHASWNSQG